jgi:predicted peptidase
MLAAVRPDRFAAVVTVCASGNPAFARALKGVPVWAFHGGNDPIVPPARSRAMFDALEAAGSDVAKLTVYPGVGHGAWERAYEEPELYDWLLEQKRPPLRRCTVPGFFPCPDPAATGSRSPPGR